MIMLDYLLTVLISVPRMINPASSSLKLEVRYIRRPKIGENNVIDDGYN